MHKVGLLAALNRACGGGFGRQDGDVQAGAQRLDVFAHHAEAVATVGRIFEPGDGLLLRAEQLSDLFLGQAARPAQGGELQRDIPGLVDRLEAGAQCRVLEFAFQVAVKDGFFQFPSRPSCAAAHC